MMFLALLAIPMSVVKSGGRDIENMRWVPDAWQLAAASSLANLAVVDFKDSD